MSLESKDLLIADLEHFGESLWRNEEIGEKRLNFFITLAAAVASGLVALATSDKPPSDETLRGIVATALSALLVLGLVTYLRMLKRNQVTDQYHRTLKHIRETYAKLFGGLESYRVPVPPKPRKFGGGYAETMGTIEGLLAGALIWQWHPAMAVFAGAIVTFVAWAVAIGSRYVAPDAKEGS
jgi:hypothetical protein